MPSPSGSLATLRPDLAGLFHEFEIESAQIATGLLTLEAECRVADMVFDTAAFVFLTATSLIKSAVRSECR